MSFNFQELQNNLEQQKNALKKHKLQKTHWLKQKKSKGIRVGSFTVFNEEASLIKAEILNCDSQIEKTEKHISLLTQLLKLQEENENILIIQAELISLQHKIQAPIFRNQKSVETINKKLAELGVLDVNAGNIEQKIQIKNDEINQEFAKRKEVLARKNIIKIIHDFETYKQSNVSKELRKIDKNIQNLKQQVDYFLKLQKLFAEPVDNISHLRISNLLQQNREDELHNEKEIQKILNDLKEFELVNSDDRLRERLTTIFNSCDFEKISSKHIEGTLAQIEGEGQKLENIPLIKELTILKDVLEKAEQGYLEVGQENNPFKVIGKNDFMMDIFDVLKNKVTKGFYAPFMNNFTFQSLKSSSEKLAKKATTTQDAKLANELRILANVVKEAEEWTLPEAMGKSSIQQLKLANTAFFKAEVLSALQKKAREAYVKSVLQGTPPEVVAMHKSSVTEITKNISNNPNEFCAHIFHLTIELLEHLPELRNSVLIREFRHLEDLAQKAEDGFFNEKSLKVLVLLEGEALDRIRLLLKNKSIEARNKRIADEAPHAPTETQEEKVDTDNAYNTLIEAQEKNVDTGKHTSVDEECSTTMVIN